MQRRGARGGTDVAGRWLLPDLRAGFAHAAGPPATLGSSVLRCCRCRSEEMVGANTLLRHHHHKTGTVLQPTRKTTCRTHVIEKVVQARQPGVRGVKGWVRGVKTMAKTVGGRQISPIRIFLCKEVRRCCGGQKHAWPPRLRSPADSSCGPQGGAADWYPEAASAGGPAGGCAAEAAPLLGVGPGAEEAEVGLGRIVALYCRSYTLYKIH